MTKIYWPEKYGAIFRHKGCGLRVTATREWFVAMPRSDNDRWWPVIEPGDVHGDQ
jgi:hypothetical protein